MVGCMGLVSCEWTRIITQIGAGANPPGAGDRPAHGSAQSGSARRNACRAARAMLAASTPKKARSAARVSLRPKPSVPSVR